jgi:peptide/nickel transport system ATP-binding protein
MSVLSVRDLTVSYSTQAGPVPAVRGVSFDIERGQVLGLAGESGCGKSTVAHAILRLLPDGSVTEGEILLEGENILRMKPGRLRAVRWTEAAIVFQGAMHGLNPVQRVGEQIAECILVHQRNPGRSDERAAAKRSSELIEKVGLPERRARDFPHELSGGQRQRVMIAMALACEPALVIADEPTTALDVMVQAQVLNLLEELQTDLGLSMLFITHDLSVLVDACDRIAVMYAGLLVEEGAASAVFETPVHPYTRALAAAFPDIGDMDYRMAPSGLPGDPPDPMNLPTGCAFHVRCPVAVDRCTTEEPPLEEVDQARTAACLLVEPRGLPR